MRNFLFTLTLLASVAVASPTSKGYEVRSAEDGLSGPLVPMQFKGPVIPGGPEVELEGTAQDIYEQVLKLNPAYTPWDFPDFQAKMAEEGVTRRQWEGEQENAMLGKRTSPNPGFATLQARANIICEWGDYVRTWGDCSDGLVYLNMLGTAWCRAPARACSRVSCSHDCGIFLCSDKSSEMAVHCRDITKDVGAIYTKCNKANIFMTPFRGVMQFGDHSTGVKKQQC